MIDSGGTALAVAAEPMLGRAGYWMMTVTALFATAGATNSGLYPAAGLCEQMASIGQFPPLLGRRLRRSSCRAGSCSPRRSPSCSPSASTSSSIASIGSVIALRRVHAGHRRSRPCPPRDRRARLVGAAARPRQHRHVLVTFVFTTLVDEPATAVALVVILVLSIVLDLGWKHVRDGRAPLDATPAIGG